MPYISVYVDADDVLGDIDTSDLIAELKSRREAAADEVPDDFRDRLEEVRSLLLRGRAHDALGFVERMLDKPADWSRAYEKAKANRDPISGRPIVS